MTLPQSRCPPIKLTLCLFLLGFTTLGIGCGAVGPVIAPEDIGIEKKLREEQQKVKAQSQEPRLIPLEDHEVELPPLRPVGTR